jgi:cytidylate kinase
MDCKVISISRALAAGGEEIGRDVAARLGFRFVDDEIVSRAAEKAGVSPQTIEKVERMPPLIDRILRNMGSVPVEHAAYIPAPSQHSPAYETLIEQVIRQTAAQGDVVIVAHGASIPLAGTPGLLRVLITGSPESRTARLAASLGEPGRRAKKAIEHSDRERRDYLQRFYNIREEQPSHYDIVLNTDVLSFSTATEIVVAAARAGGEPTEAV